jgi:uncharacterized protein DUF6796
LSKMLLAAGWVGLVGAVLVGAGEFTLQFSPAGGYNEAGYEYFRSISANRIVWGHFLSVLAAPLYLVGYWHLAQVFIRGGSRRAGWAIGALGGYAFVVGNAWLGGRAFLAFTAQAVGSSENSGVASRLLATFSGLNEPLVNILRVAIVIISVLWIWRVWTGETLYPRWMAGFNPGLLLGLIFGTYALLPSVGAWLLPAAMNLAHAVVFAMSLFSLRGRPGGRSAE